MDTALPSDERARVQTIIETRMKGARQAHDVRTRQAGRTAFIDFHLVVDAEMSVGAAHEICDRIEDGLLSEFEGALISIHIEPPHELEGGGARVLMMEGH